MQLSALVIFLLVSITLKLMISTPLFSKLLAEEPQAIDVLLAKITVLFFAGDIPEALEQAKAALKFDPDNVALKTAWTRIKNVSRHEVRGRAYNLFREYEAELKCWGRALEVSSHVRSTLNGHQCVGMN